MDDLINICKHRGFVFPAAEIYHGPAGFFDYGPYGVELKNNIKRQWWMDMVHRREDIVGIETPIVAPAAVWQASGHIEGFSDPMVDCRSSKVRYRADQVFWGRAETQEGVEVGYVTVLESEAMLDEANASAAKLAKKQGVRGALRPIELRDLTTVPPELYSKIPSPATGEPGALTLPPRQFNLMFRTSVGATASEDAANSVAFLRPETAQGIFVNFGTVQRTNRMKVLKRYMYICAYMLYVWIMRFHSSHYRSRLESRKSGSPLETKSRLGTSYFARGNSSRWR